MHIRFGTGSIQANMVRDKVCLGSKEQKLCVDDFLFLSAFEMSEYPFKDVHFDGIIGLGFPELSMSPDSNFMDYLIKSKKISNKVFSFYFTQNNEAINNKSSDLSSIQDVERILSKKESLNPNQQSELIIGGIDASKIDSKINFYNVISKRYWEIKLDNVYYGDYKLPFCDKIKCTAILDTGTNTIGGSDIFFENIKQLTSLNNSCKNLYDLKPISFDINGVLYSLDPIDYSIKVKLNNHKINYLIPDNKNDGRYIQKNLEIFLFFFFLIFLLSAYI